jgi:hypothetical protein
MTDETIDPEQFVPDPKVRREFGVTAMTLHRWDHDAALGFPPKIKIRNRNFRSRSALEAFKATMLRRAIVAKSEKDARGRCGC